MKSNKEKHILILTPGFPESEADSTCIPALQIYLKALHASDKLGKISVITFQYPFKTETYVWNDIKVYPLNGGNKKGLFSMMTWMMAFSRFLRINRTNRVDVIHSFWYSECTFVGSILSSIFNVPHVSTFMGQDALPKNKFVKLILKKPFIVALSQFHEKTIRKNLGIVADKIIPWGIEKSEFKKALESNRPIDVLGVGSLIPLKNYLLFIDIIHELTQNGVNLKCIIIGGGVEYDTLNERIDAYRLSETIELKGQLEYREVLDYMRKSKVLLHTSSYESFGMVFIEALQSGAKIVSKPVGCFQESDIWKTGENKEKLIEGVMGLLQKNEAENQKLYFDIRDTVNRYLAIYARDLINRSFAK